MQAKPRLEWRPQASADLLEIVAYIADDNPDAAQELKDEIEAKADKLLGGRAHACITGTGYEVLRPTGCQTAQKRFRIG